ncbi:MAG TPA: hypothetical protein VLD62_09755 [Acidimicrobiia bacterium]|nr:hypothetical protein [Acidimicrobiia bacterium]
MHAVLRTYSGPGARELFELLEQRKSEIESLLRTVSGFRVYTLIHTDEGGVTVTVCDDEAGTDESVHVARDWVSENAADLKTAPPTVTAGRVAIHVT